MAETEILIGKSRHTEQLRKRLDRLRKNRAHCAIVGEPGTGKTLLAWAIGSADAEFQTLDVAVLSENDIRDRLALQSGGTVLIEGIEAGGLRNQSLIAGFISEIGKSVRFLLTLTEDPAELVARRSLLDELYDRISRFENIEILPLRERPEDIPVLVRHFAPDLAIDINGLELLTKQLWKGNIRELETVVRRSLESSPDGTFRLPAGMVEQPTEIMRVLQGILQGPEQQLDRSLDRLESGIIRRALERFGFDAGETARFLGMTEDTLEEKAGRLGLSLLHRSS